MVEERRSEAVFKKALTSEHHEVVRHPRERAAVVSAVVGVAVEEARLNIAAALDLVPDSDDALVLLVLPGSDIALPVDRDAAVLERGLAQHLHAATGAAADLGAADRCLCKNPSAL